MKAYELSFVLLFSLYFYGIHGSSRFYEFEIEPSEIEPNSVEEEEELYVNDPHIVSLSSLAVEQLNHENLEDENPLFLLEIVKATTQVVSGNSTSLTLKVSQGGVEEMCEITILEDPWSHKREYFHSKCGTIPPKYKPHEAITNDSLRTGNAAEELDVHNKEVVRLSRIAVDELNKELPEGSEPNSLLKIVKAFVQIDSEKIMNLILTLEVSQGYVLKICEVTIQRQIWLNETKVIDSKCEKKTNETINEESEESHEFDDDYSFEDSGLIGKEREPENHDDVIDLNTNNKEVISLSAVSLIELNTEKQESDPLLTLLKILKAKLHKPSGNITLTLKVSQGDNEDTCEINVWQNYANDKFNLVHSKCGTVPATNKPENDNTKDEEVDEVDVQEVVRLSVMALVELNSHNHAGDHPINLLEIVKASRHPDSRNLTSLILKVSQGYEKKICDVKILEKFRSNITQVIESRCEIIKHDEMHPIYYELTDDPGIQDTVTRIPDETDDNYTKASDSFTTEDINSLGDEERLDVNDPEVIILSTLAMVTLNDERLKEDEPIILLEIIKAVTHLSSENFKSLTLRVSQGGTEYVCEFEIISQSDTVKNKVKNYKCEPTSDKFNNESDGTVPLLPRIQKLDVNDPKVIRLSMIGLVELYDKYPTGGPINLLEIVKASRQLVAGDLTYLKLKVSQDEYKMMCDLQILEQPWLKITKIIQAECDDMDKKDDEYLEIYGVNGLTKIIPLSKQISSW